MTIEENIAALPRQMEPIIQDNLLINFTMEFSRIWSTNGSKAKSATFWRPAPAPDALPGYFSLGDVLVPGDANINGEIVTAVVCEKDMKGSKSAKALAAPVDFELVWKETGAPNVPRLSIWRPLAPVGYVALGQVCTNDHCKPSLNSVRCVRVDLVVAANLGELIWNDKGSGAKMSFSAFAIEPPTATAGDILFTPGTFAGIQGYSKPAGPSMAYALRMLIPLQLSAPPQVPVLNDYAKPAVGESDVATHVARLPWFAVRDHAHPGEQFRNSPCYALKRTDEYVLIGHERNETDTSRATKWTAPRAQNAMTMRMFQSLTAVEINKAWPSTPLSDVRVTRFSACLPKDFAHMKASSNGWTELRPQVVIAMVPKQTAVAVYQLQSHYELIREDGTQVAVDFGYTDDDSVLLSQYPSEPVEVAETCLPMVSDFAQNAEADVIPLPTTDMAVVIDSAP
ncbi:Vps62-related protein [Pseudomonas triticicola]|uniref:Vps62-related protein n=1 Tax=Pseudomonas triticicola TaxID=2842345 RepID=UPI003EBA103E